MADYSLTMINNDLEKEILNNLVEGFFLVNEESRLVMINEAAKKILLIEGHDEGKLVSEVFHNADLLDLFTPRRAGACQTEITLDDGRIFIAQGSLIPGTGLAVLLHEITQLKELDRIKTDFVNTLSHDLRSPLTAIYGYVGLIDRIGPVNEQQAEFIHHIQSSLQQITAFINDLLELSRVEASYDQQMSEVNLAEIIAHVMEIYQIQASQKKQDIMLCVPDQVPVILGNPLQLQRMVSNLVDNAVKFTRPHGRISINCKVEVDQLILEIADNGRGIPSADQAHIFEKFFRGSNLSEDEPGTGLGLPIVKSIVEKHHGRIWVESTPAGTTFSIILPLK